LPGYAPAPQGTVPEGCSHDATGGTTCGPTRPVACPRRGEDVKEHRWYPDALPSHHVWNRCRYHYLVKIRAFPPLSRATLSTSAESRVHYAAASRHDDPFHSPPSGVAVDGLDDTVSPKATHWLAFRQFTPKRSDDLPVPGPGTLCAVHFFPL
jgi:hypothetical protein